MVGRVRCNSNGAAKESVILDEVPEPPLTDAFAEASAMLESAAPRTERLERECQEPMDSGCALPWLWVLAVKGSAAVAHHGYFRRRFVSGERIVGFIVPTRSRVVAWR